MSASRQSSDKRCKVYGIMGTVMLHVAVLALLWAVKINATETPDDDEGGGIYVMAGMGGSEWNYTETVPANELESGIEENITQDLEESINIDNSDKERQQQEEARKAAEREQAEERRKIDDLISGALNKNNGGNGNGGSQEGGAGIRAPRRRGLPVRKHIRRLLPRPPPGMSGRSPAAVCAQRVLPGRGFPRHAGTRRRVSDIGGRHEGHESVRPVLVPRDRAGVC